jgi:hypothetical protein
MTALLAEGRNESSKRYIACAIIIAGSRGLHGLAKNFLYYLFFPCEQTNFFQHSSSYR